jgi:hypothetical protein
MIFSMMSPTPNNETDVKFVEAETIEQAVEKLLRHAPNWRDRGSLNVQNHGEVVR